jgi:hypothetical protein
MHSVHHSISTPALAALLMLGTAPVLAQTPDEPSSRAGLMEQARETSAEESVPPSGTAGPVLAILNMAQSRAAVPPDVRGPVDGFGARYAVARIGMRQPQFPHWIHAVVVTIRNRNSLLDVVGIDRPTDLPGVVANRRASGKP